MRTRAADYLDAKGASVRKALLRTPIDGARLSSGYGKRKHPILGYNKKHLGVDFAAPIGTPIYAAGDGTITMIGRHGNAGNYIRIRHNGTYNTSYSHLSGFAEGMKQGKRVRQGRVIGYVGSTGMSTGPHLHYEVMRGSNRINPMTLKLPSGRKLEGSELAAFRRQVLRITGILVEARGHEAIKKIVEKGPARSGSDGRRPDPLPRMLLGKGARLPGPEADP